MRLLKKLTIAGAVAGTALMSAAGPAKADGPGPGLTGSFERAYLHFIIDHHFAALRMTELAAGTQLQPPPAPVVPDDTTSPSPSFPPTEAKAASPELRSLARRNNRTQREEILMAQTFLQQWYGDNYQGQITSENQQRINILENTAPGASFDVEFSRVFSRHHFVAAGASLQCLVADDVTHVALERYCNSIIHTQVSDIDEMRHLLAQQYNILDYQPLEGLEGKDSGPQQ